MTSQKWEKCQPFWVNSFFPALRKKKVACASPHNAFYCSSRNVEYGWGGCGYGVLPSMPTLFPGENIPPQTAGVGKREDIFLQVSRCSWEQPEHHFMCSPLKWPFRGSGSRKHSQMFDSGLFSREGWVETASSSWALNSVPLKLFQLTWEKGGDLSWKDLKHSIYEKGRANSCVVCGFKTVF